MKHRSSNGFRLSVNKYLLLTSLLLIAASNLGCSPKTTMPPYWLEASSLYVNHSPYSQLYVEIDRIEGVRIDEQYIEELKSFLGQYTDKPDGIVIKIDDPIPFKEFEHVPIHWASILAMDGPVGESASRSAYLHIFAHNRKEDIVIDSHVVPYCPNTVFWSCHSKKQRLHALIHEVGHVLGLAHKSGHDTGGHCNNGGCLMAGRPDLAKYLWFQFGGTIMSKPCKDCVNDNVQIRGVEQEHNIAFSGPFLFRREKEYVAAFLPGSCTIVPAAEMNEFDWVSQLNKLKNYFKKTTSKGEYAFNSITNLQYDTWGGDLSRNEDDSFLKAAFDDPAPIVRIVARKMFEKGKSQKADSTRTGKPWVE